MMHQIEAELITIATEIARLNERRAVLLAAQTVVDKGDGNLLLHHPEALSHSERAILWDYGFIDRTRAPSGRESFIRWLAQQPLNARGAAVRDYLRSAG